MPAPPTRAKVRAPAPPPRPPLSDRARDAERRLAEARLEARALLAEQGLRRLKESAALDYGRGWTEAYGQLLDRFQHGRDWLPIGSPTSRKHGANFPFFQTETELALVRDLSRILVGTNNHAWGMLRGLRSFVIGTGYRFAVTPRRPKKAASRKAAKFLTAFLDAWAARTRWMERQRELFWRCHRDGDALLRLFPDDGWLKLRFAWPEQLTQPPGETFEEWGFGVRADPEDAEDETAYYLASVADPARGDFVPAAQVLHLKANADTGIKRGLPDFSFGTKDALDAAGRLTRNLGEGSAVRAAIAFIRQHAAATEAEVSAWNTADADYTAPTAWGGGPRPVTDHDPGEVHDIPEGLEYAGAPSDAGTAGHAQVVQVLLRSAGVRWNAPEWLVSGDASNMGAYTSSLVAESPFVRSVTEAQDYYRSRYLEVVRRAVVCAEAHGVVERGTLALCLLDLEPPTPEVRDKAAESQRAAVEIPLGVDSRQRYCSSQGRDFDKVARENQEYNDKFGGDGQQLPDQPPDQPPGGGAGAPTPAAGGDGDEDPMALPESLLESEEVTDIRLRLLEADAPAGKVWKEITYTSKSGKQVTQKRLVNAPKAAAAKKTAAKKEPVKKVAGKAAAAKAVKKPAAKKEPAKKPEKPAKADPKATAEAVHAALRGDPEKLTPEAVKDLHAKLNTLTVGQIQAIKKVHDLRGGKTKAEHVAALVAKAEALKKAADAAKNRGPAHVVKRAEFAAAMEKAGGKLPDVDGPLAAWQAAHGTLAAATADLSKGYAKGKAAAADKARAAVTKAYQAYTAAHEARKAVALKQVEVAKKMLSESSIDGGAVAAHGMTDPEKTRKIVLDGVSLHYPDTPEGHDQAARTLVSIGGHNFPPDLWGATSRIVLSSQRNNKDGYWAEQYKTPGFTSAATGGDGTTVVYNGGPIGPSTLAHEGGHNLATKMFGSTHPPADSEYGKAHAKEPPVSDYAKHNVAEDFAEAVSQYSLGGQAHADLKAKFPLKYAAVHNLLGGT